MSLSLLLLINLFLSFPNCGLHANTFPISDVDDVLAGYYLRESREHARCESRNSIVYYTRGQRIILRARLQKYLQKCTMNFGVYTKCFARCAFKKFKEYDSEVLHELYEALVSLSYLTEIFRNYTEFFMQ